MSKDNRRESHGRPAQMYRYAWGNNPRRGALKGRLCVVEVRGGRMNTVLVRFLDDGERVTTSYRALRAVTPEPEP